MLERFDRALRAVLLELPLRAVLLELRSLK
jgi:hypothetical protein